MRIKRVFASCLAATFCAALCGCRGNQKTTDIPAPRDDFAPSSNVTPRSDVPRPNTAPNVVYNMKAPILPNAQITPGDALEVESSDICVSGYTKKVRDVPTSVKNQVYAAYGITSRAPYEYEVDHLISLELGGSNSIRNLWPQSYHTPIWNARSKDALENELHRRICSGQISMKTAQKLISVNWIAGYRKVFGRDPLPREEK